MSTRTNVSKRWSALLATAALVVGLAVTGCGGSSNAPSHAAAGYGAPAASTATAPAKPAASATPAAAAKPAAAAADAGIPQNNGGDQDADNNGGPSDGDGNI
jgi:hypothetical protein